MIPLYFQKKKMYRINKMATVKELRDTIKEYKKNSCKSYTKLNKDGLIQYLKEMNIPLPIKTKPVVKQPTFKQIMENRAIAEKQTRLRRNEHRREVRSMFRSRSTESTGPYSDPPKEPKQSMMMKRKKSRVLL